MALHPNFPRSPYETLPPDLRWFPAAEELRSTAYEKLLPPLVAKIREEVKAWRDAGYAGASATSRADGLELAFAAFLESAPDVQAFGKNYMAVGFKIEFVKGNGELSTYTPDFIVRTTKGEVWIVETKGREELDLPQKMARLRQWCEDATEACKTGTRTNFGFVYVDQARFEAHKPGSFSALLAGFRDYQEHSI